jgi:hypothetical protein
VSSIADHDRALGQDSLPRYVVAEDGKPGLHASVVGVDERAIEIEDYRLGGRGIRARADA